MTKKQRDERHALAQTAALESLDVCMRRQPNLGQAIATSIDNGYAFADALAARVAAEDANDKGDTGD